MKSDVKGCSTCPPGEERWEEFMMGGRYYYQYDYRTKDGKLFSIVRPTLKLCRESRDKWQKGGAK